MSKKRKADSLPTAGSDFGGAAKPLKTEHKDFASSEPNPKKLRKAETDELTTTPNIEATNKKRRGPPNPLARKYGHHVHGPAKGAPPGGASGIKKRIRDTERLLKKTNLPANTRVDLERRLKALNIDLSKLKRSDLEEKLHKKYKYVKFVEEKKINRKVAALQKQIETAEGAEKKELQKDLEERLTDLAYIKYFPRDMKYISVVVDVEGTKSEEQRSVIRKFIASARTAGKLDQGAFAVRKADVFGKSGDEGAESDADRAGEADAGQNDDKDDFFMAGSDDDEEGAEAEGEAEDEDDDDDALPVKAEKGDVQVKKMKKAHKSQTQARKDTAEDQAKSEKGHAPATKGKVHVKTEKGQKQKSKK